MNIYTNYKVIGNDIFLSKLLHTHIEIWNRDTGVDQADVVY